jgi:hypothetical protein
MVATQEPELSLIGNTTPAANTDIQNTDAKLVIQATPVLGSIIRGWAYLDGNGTGVGNEDCRFVVYNDVATAPSALLGFSSTVNIVDGQAFGWVQFDFSTPVILDSVAPIWIGIHTSTPATINAKRAAGGIARFQATDSDLFTDGAADPFGTVTGTPSSQLYSFYVEIIDRLSWPVRPNFIYLRKNR